MTEPTRDDLVEQALVLGNDEYFYDTESSRILRTLVARLQTEQARRVAAERVIDAYQGRTVDDLSQANKAWRALAKGREGQ